MTINSLALVFILLGSTIHAQQSLERIIVSDNEFVDEQGNVFVFRGYSSSDPDKLESEGSWNERYFQELKNWGANVVRFPVHPQAWRDRGKDEYLELLDQGIQWAEQFGMYVIMDWHSIGNLRTNLFLDDRYYTDLPETFNFWRTIAQRYGDNPVVAFYELFNEPTTYNNKFGSLSWDQWKPIMEDLILMTRANGAKGIPLIAGFNWAYDLTPVADAPIQAEGVGYVSHPYPQKRAKPWEDQWTADWGYVKEKYPIVLSEIGFCDADDHGAHVPVISDESYGQAITAYADDRNISYVVWVFDKEWSPRLFIDKKFTPSDPGAFWKAKLNGYQSE